MAYQYDKLLTHKGVRYDYTQNRANSAETYIIAIDKKNGDSNVIASIDNKTNKITFDSSVPVAIKRRISNAWQEL